MCEVIAQLFVNSVGVLSGGTVRAAKILREGMQAGIVFVLEL